MIVVKVEKISSTNRMILCFFEFDLICTGIYGVHMDVNKAISKNQDFHSLCTRARMTP